MGADGSKPRALHVRPPLVLDSTRAFTNFLLLNTRNDSYAKRKPLDMQVFTCLLSPPHKTRQMDADKVFKALGDPTRRKLLDLLCEKNGQTLGELCEHLDMARQSATQHIGILEAAQLVSTVWRGREKLHFINPVPLHEVYERWVRKFERQRLSLLHDLKKELEGE